MPKTRDYMTIGEVVENLSRSYPDLTISKVRFLEEEGLVCPARTAGGYRKFTAADMARIEVILKLQKEQFLPLAVIKEKLKDLDKGRVSADMQPVVAGAQAVALPFDEAETLPIDRAPSALGLPVAFIRELAEFGLVQIVKGETGDELSRSDAEVAHIVSDLRRFGVEPRHLRMFENFAERQAALFSQILMPVFRTRTPESRQKLVESLQRLTELSGDLERQLLKRSLSRTFEDVS